MTVEFAPTYTPSQLENQRLLRVGPGASMPDQVGDKSKRITRKLAILGSATALDLGESWVAEKLLEKVGESTEHASVNRRSAVTAAGFVEDMLSDEAYVIGMNAVLRRMTGVEEATYPTRTAKLIAGWANLLSFASGKFQDTISIMTSKVVKKMPFWKKPWNLVNAVNTEAFIGLLEEIPWGVGNAVARGHDYVDNKLRKSELVQLGEAVARTAVTGYHIEKNMRHDSRPIAPSPVLPTEYDSAV